MTQAFKIIEENKHEVYECQETCVLDINVYTIPDGTASDVSSAVVTIISPCGTTLVNEQAMTNDATGQYSYAYSLITDCEYGEYRVLYNLTNGTTRTLMSNSFFVFRTDLINKVRSYSGIGVKSVNDEDLARITLDALREACDEVFLFHHDEKPIADPDYGVTFNGTNTVVRTRCGNLADHDFDGHVYGYGANPCSGDITGYWYDSDYVRHTAKITVNDSISGRITLTKTDDSAIPSNNQGVYISYWTEWESYNENIFEDAVAYLAAHHLILRMTDLHSATAADLPSNQKKIELNLERFKNKYEALRNKISKPYCDGV